MPELPEVETMRRGIGPVVGGTITAVQRLRTKAKPITIFPSLGRFRRRAVGQRIVGTGRVGKRVFLQLSSSHRLVFEPRMTGLVLLADPPSQAHLRLRLSLQNAPVSEVLYWDRRGLGSVKLFTPAEFEDWIVAQQIGPDALVITAETLAARLKPSRRAIKVALLDQKAVAGIGNLYAAEILHRAGIHPERTCNRVRLWEYEQIHAAMQEILEEAIRYEGSTLGDGTYRNALNQDGSYQNQHRVYARDDETCPTCGRAAIVRIVQAQRSTFFCPACQPKRPPRKPK